MANIFVTIQKEVEKGNTLVDKKGNFINPEKVETMAKKSYVQDLKSGTIGFDKSFQDYLNDILEKSFLPTSTIITWYNHLFNDGEVLETPEMPEPVTPNDLEPENVAN